MQNTWNINKTESATTYHQQTCKYNTESPMQVDTRIHEEYHNPVNPVDLDKMKRKNCLLIY